MEANYEILALHEEAQLTALGLIRSPNSSPGFRMIALTRGKVLGKKFKSAKCSAFRAVAHTQQEEVEKCTDTAGTC